MICPIKCEEENGTCNGQCGFRKGHPEEWGHDCGQHFTEPKAA